MRTYSLFSMVCLSACAILSGCGVPPTPPPQTYPAQGQVIVDGQLAKGGAVLFDSVSEPRWTTQASIEEDGTFKLSILHETKNIPGAVPGEYRVTIMLPSIDQKTQRDPIILEKHQKIIAGDNSLKLEVRSP